MIRIPAIEKALPRDVREAVRDHPFLTVAAGAFAGYYLGRSHGRLILSALVSIALSAGTSRAKKMLGVESPPRLARVR